MKFSYLGNISEPSGVYDFLLSEDRETIAKIRGGTVTMLSQAEQWLDAAKALDARNRIEGDMPNEFISLDIGFLEYDGKDFLALIEDGSTIMCFGRFGDDSIILPRSPELVNALHVSAVAERMRGVAA